MFGIDSLMELPVVQVRGENGEKIDVSPDVTLRATENDSPDTHDTDVRDGDTENADDTGSDAADAEIHYGAVSSEDSTAEQSAKDTPFALPLD